jgi:hypothetical protein
MKLIASLWFCILQILITSVGASAADLPLPRIVPSVQSYGDSNKSCTSWTDGCVTCKRDGKAEVACSNIGIACQPKGVRCLDSTKKTTPKPHATNNHIRN